MKENTNYKEKKEKSSSSVNKRFNDTLNKLIEGRFRTKQRLANVVGVDRSYISQIVHGHIKPDNGIMIAIAKALGVDSREIWE